MDSLTHAVLGACLGEVTAGQKIGKKAMLLGALVSNAPDIDVVCYLWMNPTAALLAHRGITHSIFFNILLAFFLAFIFKKLFRHDPLSYRGWLFMTACWLFVHLFLDLFNAYGTGIFEPFSEQRISFNALYIIDPFFTLPLLVSAIALLAMKRHHPGRLRVAANSMLISTLYLLIGVSNKIYVNRVAEKNMADLGLSPVRYITSPAPFNNMLWYVVVQDNTRFLMGYYSVFDRDAVIALEPVNRNDSLLEPYSGTGDLENLKRFSQGFYCANQRDSSVMLNDLRFGREEGWSKHDADFNFSFDFKNDRRNVLLVQRGRFKALRWEPLRGMVLRILNGRPLRKKAFTDRPVKGKQFNSLNHTTNHEG